MAHHHYLPLVIIDLLSLSEHSFFVAMANASNPSLEYLYEEHVWIHSVDDDTHLSQLHLHSQKIYANRIGFDA
jgi:hypothetical protein